MTVDTEMETDVAEESAEVPMETEKKDVTTFTLEVLQLIKEQHAQHGLRHGDYQRYFHGQHPAVIYSFLRHGNFPSISALPLPCSLRHVTCLIMNGYSKRKYKFNQSIRFGRIKN